MSIFGTKRTDLKRENFSIDIAENINTSGARTTSGMKYRATIKYVPTGQVVKTVHGFTQGVLWRMADAHVNKIVAGKRRLPWNVVNIRIEEASP